MGKGAASLSTRQPTHAGDKMEEEAKKEYQKQWHLKNYKASKRGRNDGRSKDAAHQKKLATNWRKTNYNSRLWSAAKNRAKKRDIKFTLEKSDIVVPEYCPVLGIKIEYGADNIQTSASIDRIDPNKGYTKDNIQVISFRANSIKQDATPEELRKLADYMEKIS